MGKTPLDRDFINTVIDAASRVKIDKIRTSFLLDAEEYKEFQRLCENLGPSPSRVVNAFIAKFNEYQKRNAK